MPRTILSHKVARSSGSVRPRNVPELTFWSSLGGAFSQDPKFKTGILRIKNGTQEIDPDYNWVFNDQVIEGEPGKTVWLASTHYLGNGKLYGMMDIADYWENPSMPNWTRDRSIISVEIDLYAKTVKKLPIPRTCAYATHVSTYNDLLVFSVWGEQESGFYTYDPNTGEVSDGSVINAPTSFVGDMPNKP